MQFLTNLKKTALTSPYINILSMHALRDITYFFRRYICTSYLPDLCCAVRANACTSVCLVSVCACSCVTPCGWTGTPVRCRAFTVTRRVAHWYFRRRRRAYCKIPAPDNCIVQTKAFIVPPSTRAVRSVSTFLNFPVFLRQQFGLSLMSSSGGYYFAASI